MNRVGRVLPAIVCAAVSANVMAEEKAKGAATMGQPFRRMMVSHYGNEIDVGGDKVRAYYVIDVDAPAGGSDAEKVSAFIGALLCQVTNQTDAVGSGAKPHSDFGQALGLRRKVFFERSEKRAFAGFAYLEGRTDLSDEHYIGYSIHENSWTGSKTGGDYYTTFGVFGRKEGRRMTLGDFFAPEKIPALDAVIREAYAQRGPQGNCGTFENFRKKFPRDPSGMTTDPAASDNFSITPHGLKWAFIDTEIVGFLSAAKEFPVEVEIPWSQLEPLLRDKALLPRVRF